jgi:putative SbcD/Mre11-related phosphoesterase
LGFRISKDVEVAGDLPGLVLKNRGILVVADLHIGYEQALQRQGIYIPRSTYVKTKQAMSEMIEKARPEKIVILGDVKHEFGVPSSQEWVEVKDLLRWLLDMGLKVHVVRGNHDNYIIAILKKFGIELHYPVMVEDSYVMVHGHEPLEEVPEGAEVLLMGHEHPAITVRDSLGVKRKFKCFLRGSWRGLLVVVLPALSPLASGSTMNECPQGLLLSPMLKESVDVDSFKPIVVEPGAGVYEFPELGKLKYTFI